MTTQDVLSEFISTLKSLIFVRFIIHLLMIDAVFILLHVLQVFFKFRFDVGPHWVSGGNFRLDMDGTYSEFYEYIKILLCTFALLTCFVRRGPPIYLSLALVYMIALLDNAFRIHEYIGSISPFGRGRSELFFFVALGGLMSIMLWRTRPRENLEDTGYAVGCVLLLGMLAFFAVGIDAFHAIFWRSSDIEPVLGLLEDGGELIALSFNLVFVWSVATRPSRARAQIFRSISS